MSMNLPFTQNDRDQLVELKEGFIEQNTQLTTANDTNIIDVAKLLMVDVPYKKKNDPPHNDIFLFEEELRRLIGQSVINPLQEDGILITDSIADTKLQINNNRLTVTESGSPIINAVPIIPVRGWSKSKPAGINFDIWSRDRHGSSTSGINGTTSFTVDSTHRKFRTSIDGVEQEVDLSEILTLPATVSGAVVASNIQGLFQGIEVGSTLSANDGPYDISDGDSMSISVDGGLTQIATFSLNVDIIITVDNNMLDYEEVVGTDLTITVPPATYTPALLASTIEALLNEATKNHVTYSVTYANKKFTISSDGGDFDTFSLLFKFGPNTKKTIAGKLGFLIKDFRTLLSYTSDDVIFRLTTAQVVSVLSSNWTGVTVTAEDLKIRVVHNGSSTFKITDGTGSPNAEIGLSEHNILAGSSPFTLMNCFFNEGLTTFTVIAGSVGPSSIVEVKPASSDDLKNSIGFSTQKQIAGKYQNNLLKIKIDNEDPQTVKLADFRKCESDLFLGDNNDDFGVYWSGDKRLGYIGNTQMGPLFCSGINNGKDVAKSIQAKIREIGDAYKDVICTWYSDDQVFVIYSGTFGINSSVHVLSADDSLRDVRLLLGYDGTQEEVGHEEYYETLGKLASKLNTYPNISASASNSARLSHSLLYQRESGINIYSGWQSNYVPSTSIYDNGSRGLPRLFPNGNLIVDSSNNKLNFYETLNVELTAYIPDGEYSTGDLAEAITNAMSGAAGVTQTYTCKYLNKAKVFQIYASTNVFGLYCATAKDKLNSIWDYIGFDLRSDRNMLTVHYSDRIVEFTNPDFFNAVFPTQFWQYNRFDVIAGYNDKLNFRESGGELTITIPAGSYTGNGLASQIAAQMTVVGVYTYNANFEGTVKYRFRFYNNGIFSLLFGSGTNHTQSIAATLGFNASDHLNGNNFYSDNLIYATPFADDHTVDEESALYKEEDYLGEETSILNRISNETIHDNERDLDYWEWLATNELAKVVQEYNAIRAHRGYYDNHIDVSDPDYTTNISRKTTALNNLIPNLNSLSPLLAYHGALVDLVMKTNSFTAGADFTEGGTEALTISVSAILHNKIYNKPAPLVRYNTINKHISGSWSPAGLFSTSASYTPSLPGIKLRNYRTGTEGYTYSTAGTGTYSITGDTSATVINSNSPTYDMSGGNDTLKMKIDGGTEQTATFNATNGYVESTSAVTSKFVIKTGTNDRIDFSEGAVAGETTCVNSETYNLTDGDTLLISVSGGGSQIATFNTADFSDITAATAAEIVIVLNTDWSGVTASVDGTKVKITHDTAGDYKFQISDGTGNPNVQLGFSTSEIWGIDKLVATISQGNYSGSDLATEIQTRLNAAGSSSYVIDYNSSNADKFTLTSNGAGAIGEFSLYWSSGPNTSRSIGYTIGFNVVDDTGGLTYVSNNAVHFTVLTGLNDTFTISIDSVMSAGNIVISQGNYASASALVTEISTQIGNDPNFVLADFTVTYPANKFRITSTTKGTESIIEVYEGISADFLRTVNLDGDIPVHGGGDVGDITAVTLLEVISVLNGEITGISAGNDGGYCRLTTLSINGQTSSIEITAGTARVILGYSLGIVYGSYANNRLNVNIDSAAGSPILLNTSTSPISGNVIANDIQNKMITLGGAYLLSHCTFNESTPWQNFANQLRIISGSYGVSSSAAVILTKTIMIRSSNKYIDFDEGAGTLTTTLVEGDYDGAGFATAIQNALNALGTLTYAVAYVPLTKKIAILATGFFSLLWKTGPANLVSIAKDAGFFKVDLSGSATYASDREVKICSASTELGFDAQTLEAGHDVTSIRTSFNGSTLTATVYWATGSRLDLNINCTISPNNKIAGMIATINGNPFYYCIPISYLIGRVSKDFRLTDGDALIVQPSHTSAQAITFSAVKGYSSSGIKPYTRIISNVNDRIRISVNGSVAHELILGTLDTGEEIANKIQELARNIYDLDREKLAGFTNLVCVYDDGAKVYTIYSGTGGTNSSVVITDGSIYNGAGVLKLGIANGGTEVAGSGDFVCDYYAKLTEVIFKINASSPINFTATGTDYLQLICGDDEVNNRISVLDCSTKTKFGFDVNDDYNSLTILNDVNTITLFAFTNQEIQEPSFYVDSRGWQTDKGDVTIDYSVIDDAQILPRISVINTRLATIPGRKPEITTREAKILEALVSSYYIERRKWVKTRLNKKSGSYAKVGQKFKQSEDNVAQQAENTDSINSINEIL